MKSLTSLKVVTVIALLGAELHVSAAELSATPPLKAAVTDPTNTLGANQVDSPVTRQAPQKAETVSQLLNPAAQDFLTTVQNNLRGLQQRDQALLIYERTVSESGNPTKIFKRLNCTDLQGYDILMQISKHLIAALYSDSGRLDNESSQSIKQTWAAFRRYCPSESSYGNSFLASLRQVVEPLAREIRAAEQAKRDTIDREKQAKLGDAGLSSPQKNRVPLKAEDTSQQAGQNTPNSLYGGWTCVKTEKDSNSKSGETNELEIFSGDTYIAHASTNMPFAYTHYGIIRVKGDRLFREQTASIVRKHWQYAEFIGEDIIVEATANRLVLKPVSALGSFTSQTLWTCTRDATVQFARIKASVPAHLVATNLSPQEKKAIDKRNLDLERAAEQSQRQAEVARQEAIEATRNKGLSMKQRAARDINSAIDLVVRVENKVEVLKGYEYVACKSILSGMQNAAYDLQKRFAHGVETERVLPNQASVADTIYKQASTVAMLHFRNWSTNSMYIKCQ